MRAAAILFGLFAGMGVVCANADELRTAHPDPGNSRKTVLLLGDSIRLGYCERVRDLLKDRATVVFPKENCMFAYFTLRKICDWVKLVDNPLEVDVVHFNNGIWDLGQRDGRDCLTPVEVYAPTMVRIAEELKHYFPNAKLIFATTTPVNQRVTDPWHTKGNTEVEKYNHAALSALKGRVDAVDDLYAFVRDNGVGRFYKDIVHYNPEGYQLLAEEVVRSVEGFLK